MLGDTGNWIHAYVPVILVARRGDGVLYRGRVLRPQGSTGSQLKFLCRTTVLRRARVRIPICVSAETVVRVFVDAKLVRAVTLAPTTKGQVTLRSLVQDVTRWTEARETTVIGLQFSSENDSESLFIPFSEDQLNCRPMLLQRRGGRYAWTSGLFFLLAWANLLTVSIVGLANYSTHTQVFRTSVLATCVLWLAGLLGLPDLASIPVRAWIRRLFAATQGGTGGLLFERKRELAVLALTGILIASSIASTQVLYGVWVRDRYTSLIQEGVKSILIEDEVKSIGGKRPVVFDALKLAPWRKEAQILVESAAFMLRGAINPEAFRSVAAALDKHPGVQEAITRASSNGPPSYLDDLEKSSSVSDPLAWYASFIIEGESEEETKLTDKARELLRSARSGESRLLRDLLDIKYEKNGDEQWKLVRSLEAQLKSLNVRGPLLKTHSYLAACDFLMGYYLYGCEQEPASEWLQYELNARSEGSPRLRLRPPHKFIVYHLFAVYNKMEGVNLNTRGADKARELAVYIKRLDPDPPDKQRCNANFDFRLRFLEIAKHYSHLSTPESWGGGTVFPLIGKPDELQKFLANSVAQGWRY